MILTKGNLSFRSVGRVADSLLTLCSPFAFAALITCGFVWAVEKAPAQTIVNTASYFQVHSGQNLNLEVPVIVQTQAHRAVYRMWLTDSSGDATYWYPEGKVSDDGRLDLSQHQIIVPAFIKSGVYILHVEVIYPFNPLKSGTILMSVATLIID